MQVREVGAQLGYRSLAEASRRCAVLRGGRKPVLGEPAKVEYVPVYRPTLKRWFVEERTLSE